MALTVTSLENGYAGNKRVNRGRLALDNSYPSLGYPLSARQVGLSVIENLTIQERLGYVFDYDSVNGTLRVYLTGNIALVGGQIAGDVVQLRGGILGKTAAGNTTSGNAAPEAAVGQDLSAITDLFVRAEGV